MIGLPFLVFGLPHLSPIGASTTWHFSNVTFTLDDGLGSTTTVTVHAMRVKGASVTGFVTASDTGVDDACPTHGFSGLTAEWPRGMSSSCFGSVTFSVDSNGTLTLAGSGLVADGTLFTGAGTGSGQGWPENSAQPGGFNLAGTSTARLPMCSPSVQARTKEQGQLLADACAR